MERAPLCLVFCMCCVHFAGASAPLARHTIQYFGNGLLSVENGTSLRSLLADALNCDPMRISKKFVGEDRIGKKVFQK